MSVLGTTPLILGQTSVSNPCPDRGCAPYSSEFVISQTKSKTRSWTHSVGVAIEVGTSFKAGFPFLAEGKVDTKITTSYEHTWGTQETEQKSWSS